MTRRGSENGATEQQTRRPRKSASARDSDSPLCLSGGTLHSEVRTWGGPELRWEQRWPVSHAAPSAQLVTSCSLINSSAMNFRARQKKLRDHLATTRFDALLISHLPNIRYLCGFTGSAGLLLVEEGGSVFITDVRYDTQAHDEVKGARVIIARKALLTATGEWIGARRKTSKGRAIGIESEHMT